MKRLTLFFFIIALGVAATVGSILTSKTSHSANAADWKAGRIIDDDIFFNGNAMSVQEIQNFLNSQAPACDTWGKKMYSATQTRAQHGASVGNPPPFVCLKDYYENPSTHQTNFNPTASVPDGALSAAQIIHDVSTTFNINPKVLLVTLKKEASLNLIGDDWPMLWQYRTAMGYGCPDTAPCDEQYYGFYNQMYNAARQFRLYANYPASYRYKAYQTNYVQFNPNAACSGTHVYVENQSTAGLYSYTPYQPNAAALNNLYGTGDNCSAYGNRNFWRIYNDWFGSTLQNEVFIGYQAHVGGIGWMGWMTNSGQMGTVGQSKSIEAISISGDIEYSSYNRQTGWQPTVNRGMISGTTGLGRSIQAIKIKPFESLSEKYDLYYRVHVSNVGWMGWTKGGQPAGVTGGDFNIEAIQIQLVPKGLYAPGSESGSYINNGVVTYSPQLSLDVTAHVGYVGWQPTVTDTMTSGTVGQDKRIEALKIALKNTTGKTGSIIYSSHVANKGWLPFVSNNEVSGTVGEALQMEAIRITLTGQLGDDYDVWYRTHVKYSGWLGWTKNGLPAGSTGPGRQLEAVEVRLVQKNTSTYSIENNALYNPGNLPAPDLYNLLLSAHVAKVGWVNGYSQNDVAGTVGQARAAEAFRIDTITTAVGPVDLTCTSYSRNLGWSSPVNAGGVCGTVGQAIPLEGLKLKLTGEAASKFDVYYKAHVSGVGWQNWVKNDETAGVINAGKNIEAIVVKLVQK